MAQQAHHIIPVDVFKKIADANLDINFGSAHDKKTKKSVKAMA